MDKQEVKVPWGIVKDELLKEYVKWCRDPDKTVMDIRNVFEFMMQKNFIKGKQWLRFVGKIVYTPRRYFEMKSHWWLREGYIPEQTLIRGVREDEQE